MTSGGGGGRGSARSRLQASQALRRAVEAQHNDNEMSTELERMSMLRRHRQAPHGSKHRVQGAGNAQKPGTLPRFVVYCPA